MARVLIVDDYEDSARLFAKLLTRSGYEVETLASAQHVVQVAETFNPMIILCDIGMPDVDGYQVARVMKAHPTLRSIPLIALTGYARESDKQASLDAGFDLHLTKPVDVGALRSIVDSVAKADGAAKAAVQ